MTNTTVLITGATGTIGRATALELAKNDAVLILLGRDPAKLERVKTDITTKTGNGKIDVFIADLSEPEKVKKAVATIKKKHSQLNALINVAAVFRSKHLENSRGNEYMFATNHLGPFFLTNSLLDLLRAGKPSRIITVTAPSVSKIDFEELTGMKKSSAGSLGVFGASKMMNLMFTYALARRIEGTGVTASAFHPGLVKSNLTDEMPAILNFIFKRISAKPDKAAKMLCSLSIDLKYSNSNGTFYKYNGKEFKSNKYSYNIELQERLWDISEQLLSKIR